MYRQNKVIIGVIALILTLTIGYAVLTQSINIKGTATAKAEFGLVFQSSDKNPDCKGYSKDCITGNLYSLSEDGKTMIVTVENLTYPTAYVELPVVVKNIGTVDAVLKAVDVNVETNSEDVSITYTGINDNETLKANEQKDVVVRVEWKEASSNPVISTKFSVSLSYAQKAVVVSSSSSSSGGDSGDTGETEDWTYKVNSDGLITAYNYAKGTDIVVPDKVDGIPVKTINQQSFMRQGNLTVYQSENAMYMVIDEEGDNYTVVKNKLITMLTGDCDEGDTDCVNNYKQMVYFCKSNTSCYNLAAEEAGTATEVAIPDGLESGKMIVSTDPNLSAEESMSEASVNISTLDLSKAANLTTIGDDSFDGAGLTSVNFGENSKLETIGNSAFSGNEISTLKLPDSLTAIGEYAFYSNQISGELVIPNSVTAIGNYAFERNQISSLTLPDSVTTIETAAFRDNQISSLTIPNSVTSIGSYAFYSNQINSLTFAENSSLTSIGDSAFHFNQISSLTIPNSVTAIGELAFYSNPLTSILIKRTKEDFLANVTVGSAWYRSTPTITYEP